MSNNLFPGYMKEVCLLILLLLLLSSKAQCQEGQFTIQGTIADAPVKVLYLQYTDYSGKRTLDSSRIERGEFSFKGKINQPTRASIKATLKLIADEENLNRATIFLEPKKLKVQVTYNQFKDIDVNGSKSQDEFNLLTAQKLPFVNQYITLRDSLAKLRERNSPGTDAEEINNRIQSAVSNMRSVSYQFIQNHPDSWVSAFELSLLKSVWPVDSVRYLFNRLSPVVQKGENGQEIAQKIEFIDRAKSSIGISAPTFSGTGLTGQVIQLSDFKGQYLLLDFWGSWCAPCRAGNPHLISLYNKYREKGIEFIGIACEDTPASWRKAIEKDGIGICKHILDSELVGNKVVSKGKSLSEGYAVDSFPTKILIDPKGVIIGRYKGGDDQLLDEKFKELFN